ncbi:LytR/AlgR family response regulator transcription factor [Thermincola ferriacetica]|nr:LytTR family DNA-binding domain-containing protein [Thermincola ferriacetica]
MLKVVIADDGPDIRNVLKKILNSISGVTVIGEAENGRQLVEMVKDMQPDIVFVDVDMPEMNGAQAAREIFSVNPNIFIVFATGYDSYTLEAFEVYACDYIMKPFEVERIHQTIARVKAWKDEIERLKIIERMASQMGNKNMKLKIQTQDSCNIIDIQDIIFITREDRKTAIHTSTGVFKTNESLEKLHRRLKTENFFRCHKGYIINADKVTELSPWGHKTYLVRLKGTKETVLMTLDKAKEFQEKYLID